MISSSSETGLIQVSFSVMVTNFWLWLRCRKFHYFFSFVLCSRKDDLYWPVVDFPRACARHKWTRVKFSAMMHSYHQYFCSSREHSVPYWSKQRNTQVFHDCTQTECHQEYTPFPCSATNSRFLSQIYCQSSAYFQADVVTTENKGGTDEEGTNQIEWGMMEQN